MSQKDIDIKLDDIVSYSPKILDILLKDRTSGRNIVWATEDYRQLGALYEAEGEIKAELVTGKNNYIIQPRITKSQKNQLFRTKAKAEVFTPAWMCNAQNNRIDNGWFGREGVFNIETYNAWITNEEKICFSDKGHKTWRRYVDALRMEITCGEAPYLVSRYDVVRAKSIPVAERIGLLDRKLRVVGENAESEEEWYKWSKRAFQSVYGFEYQGDSLLIARVNLLYTYIDYLKDKWDRNPTAKELTEIASIISWNLWQMDGLTFTVPHSSKDKKKNEETSLERQYCRIKDWQAARWKKKAILEYRSLLKYEVL